MCLFAGTGISTEELKMNLTSMMLVLVIFTVNTSSGLNCNGKADVVFMVPGAPKQIPQKQFDFIENFLIGVVNYYEISPKQTNVGLILYGKEPAIMAHVTPKLDKRDVNTRISLLAQRQLYPGIHGGHNVPKAMDAMIKLHTEHKRPGGAPKIGVILTYGDMDLSGKTGKDIEKRIREAGARAKKAGIHMFAVTSGGKVPGFESLVDGDRCRMYQLDDYSQLQELLPYLASGTCYVFDPKIKSTPHKCFPEVLPIRAQKKLKSCGPKDTGFHPDPNNCAYFVQCTGTHVGRLRTRCPGGTLYDHNIQRCNHKQFVSCWNKVKCPHSFGLFGHPHYCDKYLNCYADVPYVQVCPAGLVFNPSGYCDFPKNVKCNGRTTSHKQGKSGSKHGSSGNKGK